MQEFLDKLAALPTVALYLAMAVIAAIENVFPPIPADTVVAFGSFLAARGQGTIIGAFLSTWIGNMAGAALMYGVGRRFGAERIQKRLLKDQGAKAGSKLESLYHRYGLFALFLSRFIPGVRALVPPFAGALKLPMIRSLVIMGLASGIWYGLIAYLAFRVGSDFEALQKAIGNYGKIAAAVALIIVVIGATIWFIRRRTGKQ